MLPDDENFYSNLSRDFIAKNGTQAAKEHANRLRASGEPVAEYYARILESEIEKEVEK